MKRIDLWFQSELPISIDTSLSWYQALCQMGAKLNELVEAYNAINIENVYSKDNPPPYPVVSVNGMTGEVQLTIENIPEGVSTSDLESAKSELQALIGQQAGEKADAVKAELEPKIEALETAKSETDEWKKDFENRQNAAASSILKNSQNITRLQSTVLVMSGTQWEQEHAANVNTWYNNGARVVMVYKGDSMTDENYICDVYTLAKLGVSEVAEALRLDAPQTVILAQNVYDGYSTEQRKALYTNHIRLVVVKDPNGGNVLYAIDADGNSLPVGGSGGGGAVLSVNGKVGNVVITAESINAALDTELESAEHRIESLEDWHTQAAPEIEQAKQDANDAKQAATEAQTRIESLEDWHTQAAPEIEQAKQDANDAKQAATEAQTQATQAATDATEAKEKADKAYGPENVPPYPVEKVNNKTGNVNVDKLIDNNGTIIGEMSHDEGFAYARFISKSTPKDKDVLWFVGVKSDNGQGFIRLPDYQQEIEGVTRANQLLYSDQFPPPYPVVSVNGKTGNVTVDSLYSGSKRVLYNVETFNYFYVRALSNNNEVSIDQGVQKNNNYQAFVHPHLGSQDLGIQLLYSNLFPPPYPVTKVNGQTGDVNLTAADVGAPTTADFNAVKTKADAAYSSSNPPPYPAAPVQSVNGETGAVTFLRLKRDYFPTASWKGGESRFEIPTTIRADNVISVKVRKDSTSPWLTYGKYGLSIQDAGSQNQLLIDFEPPDNWTPWTSGQAQVMVFSYY